MAELRDFPQTRERIDAAVRAGVLDGAVILYGDADHGLAELSHGLADRNRKRPMSPDTVFDISSVSKPLGTATAVLLLAEAGKLDVGRPFTEYLPQYAGNCPEPVSVLQLATHYSGVEPDMPLGISAEEMMFRMLHSGFPRKPDTEYRYRCINYHFLGLIVENLSGQGLADFARERIFRPLGMTETNWASPLPEVRDRLVIHGRCVDSDPGIIFDRWARILYPHAMGNAGIFTTPADVARYARMILKKGEGLFRSGIVPRLMFRNLAPAGGKIPRSFGWNLDPAGIPAGLSPETIFHTGSSGQSLWIDPGEGKYCLVFSNLFGDHDEGIRTRRAIAETFLSEVRA